MFLTILRQPSKVAVYFFSVTILFLVVGIKSKASCLSGKEGNNFLIQQYEKAKKESDVTKFIVHKYKLDKMKQSPNKKCSSCEIKQQSISEINKKNLEELNEIINYKNNLLFKDECLFSAGQFQTEHTDEVKCPSEESSKDFNFCVNEEILRYENAVITDFYRCVKKVSDFPLMPEDLFELYSLESGFKPHYAYVGGVGIGQLTGIYVSDTLTGGRGRDVMKEISSLENEECEIANLIIKKDLKENPKFSNRCSFIQIGEGLERNILYTIVEFSNMWEKDISPAMRKLKKNDKKNLLEAQRLALLNAYGPGGKVATVAAIKRLDGKPAKEFVHTFQKPLVTKKGKNLTSYINKMDDRQEALTPYIDSQDKGNKINFEHKGAKACIN